VPGIGVSVGDVAGSALTAVAQARASTAQTKLGKAADAGGAGAADIAFGTLSTLVLGPAGVVVPVVDKIVLTVPPSIPVMQRWSVTDFDGLSVEPDFERALHDIQEGAETVLVTGSFHTVGDAMARLPGFAPVG